MIVALTVSTKNCHGIMKEIDVLLRLIGKECDIEWNIVTRT